MALRHAAAFAVLAALVQLAGTPAEAQNAPITTPPKIILPPAATLPDLHTIAATVKLTCVFNGSSVRADIAVTIENSGKGDADLTKHPFRHIVTAQWLVGTVGPWLNGNPAGIVISPGSGPAVLKAGQTMKTSITITNIPPYKKQYATASYTFWVIVDPNKLVPEVNENNNVSTKAWINPCK